MCKHNWPIKLILILILSVCALGWVKSGAKILSMGHHTWPKVTSLSLKAQVTPIYFNHLLLWNTKDVLKHFVHTKPNTKPHWRNGQKHTETFFKMYFFSVPQKKKVIEVWNNMKLSKWQDEQENYFHFWMNLFMYNGTTCLQYMSQAHTILCARAQASYL